MKRGQMVSVIITTKNEESIIARLIKSIKNQSYKYNEIILVDNKSWDATAGIAKKMGVKIYTFGPERSAQRNFGAKAALGEYLLFLDADMELTPDVLKSCVEICYKDKKIGGVIIPEVSIAHTFWEKVKAFERSFYNESGDEVTDAARFFKKEAFQKVGGYDETITGPEDWDLPERIKKIGFKMGRATVTIYHHERISNPFILAKKKFYYALSLNKYLQKHKINAFSAKTIYFLRPVFYKHWEKLLAHPILTLGMILMFTLELLGGGLGYFVGRFKK